MTEAVSERAVAQRTVFYIEGYDPRGPQHYHRLYRKECALQQAVNGLSVAVGPRRNIEPLVSSWLLETATTRTDYRFMRYDDLMRKRWSRTHRAVLWDIIRYTMAFLRRGVFLGMMRISWPTLITSLLAPGLLVLVALLSLIAGVAVALALPWPFGILAAMLCFAGLVMLRPKIESRFAGFWLARICAFVSDQGDGRAVDMEERCLAFASRIATELEAGETDEVLVVGHSVGSHVGVMVLARVLDILGPRKFALSFLTLGHTIPLLGLQPTATAFRNDLKRVSADRRITWIDVSAPIDSACFPLTDPVWGSGLAQADPARPSPKIVSARFPKLFTAESYARLKRDFSRSHLQYLMAAELAGDYDYFLITAGERRLGERFAHLESVKNFNRFRTARQ